MMADFLYDVDVDVPMPEPHEFSNQKHKYPFPALTAVGMSFFIPGMKSSKMSSAIINARKRFPGRNFTARNVRERRDGEMVEGTRIWRIADIES